MTRQYVQVEFNSSGSRYTYVNDEPHDITVGDEVVIETPRGLPRTVTVVDVSTALPSGIPDWVTIKPCTKAVNGGSE